jgi:hypothetical protein
MRNDDWNDEFDPGDDPVTAPEPPALPVPPAPRAAARPPLSVLIPSGTGEAEAPVAPQKVPLRVKLPIYLIAIVSIGLMCVMFFTIILLIASR